MNRTPKLAAIFLLGMFAVSGLYADNPASAVPDSEIRFRLRDAAARELSGGPTAIESRDLGDWAAVLESSAFLLFRKTELYRGTLRILVVSDGEVRCDLFPGLTLRMSSALLDGIDEEMLALVASSPSRGRNLDDLRERLVAPFIAFEAARFALDQPFGAASRLLSITAGGDLCSWEALTAPNEDETAAIDRMATLLLEAAGYDGSLYGEWLASLDEDFRDGSEDKRAYLTALPSPRWRIEALASSSGESQRDRGELRGIFSSLASAAALDEARFSLARLEARFPGSPWVLRLKTFVAHLSWLASQDPASLSVATFLPFAQGAGGEFDRFKGLLTRPAGTSAPAMPVTASADWASARSGYAALRGLYSDSLLDAADAMLQVYSREATAAAQASRLAEAAAASERGQSSLTARANGASVLALSGSDPVRSVFILEGLRKLAVSPADPIPGQVPWGFPGDSRLLLLNTVLCALKDGKSAAAERADIAELSAGTEVKPISVRNLTNGDDTDALLDKWGHPAEIVYNLVTETWYYPGLAASVTVRPGTAGAAGKVLSVTVGPRSPVSPGGELRTGDTRQEWEGAFGLPAWRSADRSVYLVNGNRISVLYLGGDAVFGAQARIREYTVEFGDPGTR